MGYLRTIIIVSVILIVVFKLLRIFYFSGGKCPKKYIKDLMESTVVITGGSTGIGFALAKEYVKYKAKKVIICSRSRNRGEVAEKKLKRMVKEESTIVEFVQLDLGSLESVENVAKFLEEENIDILILNAACLTPGERKLSKDGIELMFAVGFVGHYHLVSLLFKTLVERNVRVIATTGGQHMMPMKFPENVFSKMENVGVMEVFGLAKTCMMLLCKNLDLKFRDEDSFSSAYYLHPGVTGSGQMGMGDHDVPFHFKIIKTFAMGPISWLVGKTDEEVCQTHLYLTFAPRSELRGGGYYSDCKYVKEFEFFSDEKNIQKVWDLGTEIVQKVKGSDQGN